MSWFDFRSDLEKCVDELTPRAGDDSYAGMISLADYIQRRPSAGGEVVGRIRKRLEHHVDNVVKLTLALLDFLVKNCGSHFHLRIANMDFLSVVRARNVHKVPLVVLICLRLISVFLSLRRRGYVSVASL